MTRSRRPRLQQKDIVGLVLYCSIWGFHERLSSRELTYPLPAGIFESMIFPTSRLVGPMWSFMGIFIFTCMKLVDFFMVHVGKYTLPMDPIRLVSRKGCLFCHLFSCLKKMDRWKVWIPTSQERKKRQRQKQKIPRTFEILFWKSKTKQRSFRMIHMGVS